jgi:ATP-binding cassette subfamily C exporter for protease/lipase
MKESKTLLLDELKRSLVPRAKALLPFSLVIMVLTLAPSYYMLEVYDRVVNSRSYTTLFMLTVLVIGAYIVLEMIDYSRTQILRKVARDVDRSIRDSIVHAMFTAELDALRGTGSKALRDLRTLYTHLTSKSLLALIDAPFSLFILVLLFLINPVVGWFSVGGALVMVLLGVANEKSVHKPMNEAYQAMATTQQYVQGVIRNAQVVEAMGMVDAVHGRWHKGHIKFIESQSAASYEASGYSAASRTTQMLVGSLVLGLGAWFVLKGELGGALMIVASILAGRVIAPLVQLIANWKQMTSFADAYKRLNGLIGMYPLPQERMSLPAPVGQLNVEGVVAGPPQSRLQVLKGVSFMAKPGTSIAIAGPSASGKSTLARVMTGIWPAFSGTVRLDGSDIYTWDKNELGPSIGYLPQDVELINGTVAENIMRFGLYDESKIHQAAVLTGLNEIIDTLPHGYETQVGDNGAFLSGGQRQRIALTRAVYGMPKYLVLDEPDSSLDEAGDAALLNTILKLKQEKATVVVITHRMRLLEAMDYLMLLVDGRIQKFGPSLDVLRELRNPDNSPNPVRKAPVQSAKGRQP